MVQFETERLLIRPIQVADHDALQAMLLNPQVVAYLRYQTLKTTAEFDEAFTNHFLAEPATVFGLERKSDHQFIGFYEFHGTIGTGELTYALAPQAWGHGYVAEAGNRMMTYGFETLGLTRIEAHYASVNPRSGRVMAKMGMHDEGELMTFTLETGEVAHVMAYGLSKSDWLTASA
ncbi:N-acetyltransferase [Lactiplantibacillus garii]|uniref:N-acetyltransferase n=1 Tax=Lactiplantibacillus garii TaxID=2306423 RepID=A0A426D9N6_9LACO|nr:GNAT family N-acetyltransferase [Lactiplantibacillus garii]RRK11318.1 N-acetyltransferase [Lactiplantibacillus garii]